MKLVTYLYRDAEKIGVLTPDCTAVCALEGYADMNDLIRRCPRDRLPALRDAAYGSRAVPLTAVRLLAPIPRPAQDILCLGMNYAAHRTEAEQFHREAFSRDDRKAVYFSKRVNEAVAPGDPIQSHRDLVQDLDYECELAVVLGRDARNVTPEQVWDCVFGYTILNDVSARSLQTQHKQWYFGKSLDGFTPMGPWLVTADEIGPDPKLALTTRVNGRLRQNSNTGLMLFDIPHVLTELTRGMTLKAGTVIATGTPAGVAMGMPEPQFLQPGDIVECEIEKLGKLWNPVI